MGNLNGPKHHPLRDLCAILSALVVSRHRQHLVKSDFLSSPVPRTKGPAASNFWACYLSLAFGCPLVVCLLSDLVKPWLSYR